MTIRNIINQLTIHPKILFLIDSLGALLTTFSLFVVLSTFQQFIGMPVSVLTQLSMIAACFCIYSALCFLFLKRNWAPFIQIIGIANLLYCVLTMGVVLIHFQRLTALGIAYFLGEIVIVSVLIYIELNVAGELRKTGT
jgi:hypothetical protein